MTALPLLDGSLFLHPTILCSVNLHIIYSIANSMALLMVYISIACPNIKLKLNWLLSLLDLCMTDSVAMRLLLLFVVHNDITITVTN